MSDKTIGPNAAFFSFQEIKDSERMRELRPSPEGRLS
jgi:hypothetical protein